MEAVLGRLARDDPALDRLDLSCTRDDASVPRTPLGKDIRLLLEALCRNSHLRELSLSGNIIGDRGVADLVRFLGRHPSIEAVDLRANGLGRASVAALTNLLATTTTLRSLDLRNNELGDQLLAQLFSALAANRTLFKLCLDNELPDAVRATLREREQAFAAQAAQDLQPPPPPFSMSTMDRADSVGVGVADNSTLRAAPAVPLAQAPPVDTGDTSQRLLSRGVGQSSSQPVIATTPAVASGSVTTASAAASSATAAVAAAAAAGPAPVAAGAGQAAAAPALGPVHGERDHIPPLPSSPPSSDVVPDSELIFEACKTGNLELLRQHLTPNNVNARDARGRRSTPLHFAAGFGRKDTVMLLLQNDADVAARDEGGLIPLHNACSFGHVEVVRLLLRAGSNVNAKDNWHFTPLHEAAIKGKADVCVLLLQAGAEASERNGEGQMPFDVASDVARPSLTAEYRQADVLAAAKSGDLAALRASTTPLNVNCSARDGRMSTPLHLAAGFNRVNVCKFLLDTGANVHAEDKGGLVPLHNACSYGHYEVTQLLLERGANVNAADLWKFTPLHEAASKGRTEICLLLQHFGADHTLRNCDGKTALDVAKNQPTALVIRREATGRELLSAVQHGNFARVQQLVLAEGKEIALFKGAISGQNPLHLVADAEERGVEICEFLLRLAPSHQAVNALDIRNRTPLHFAATKGACAIIALLLKHGAQIDVADNAECTSLMLATVQNHTKAVRLLLDQGADPTIANCSGQLPEDLASASIKCLLAGAVPNADMLMLEAAKNDDVTTIRRLLTSSQGPSLVNCRDHDGRHSTPLHFAAGYNRVNACLLLLENAADVHARDKGGLVPLHNACSYGHYEVCKLLVESGAKVNVMDLWRYTPLHEAAHKGKIDIAQLLIEHGADINKRNCDGKRPVDLVSPNNEDLQDLLRGEGALLEAARLGQLARVARLCTPGNVNCRDTQGRNSTPLHLAAGYNQIEVVQFLLDQGADVDVTDRGGLIPLHNAASYGHAEVAEVLIRHNTDVNAQDKWCFTPLHEAAQKGRSHLCAMLIQHGADPNMRTQDGKTPLDLAAADDVVALLSAIGMAQGGPQPDAGPSPSAEAGADQPREETAGAADPDSSTPNLSAAGISRDVEDANDSIEAVLEWLISLKLDQLIPLFKQEHLTFDILADLGHDDLRELGVKAFGHRAKILKAVQHRHAVSRELAVQLRTPDNWTDEPVVELGPEDADFQMAANKMLTSIRQHDGNAGGVFSAYDIVSITRVQNQRLWALYAFRRAQVRTENQQDANEQLLFHGSPFVKAIVERGFDERHAYFGGMFGAGIYFAEDSSKSNQYVNGIGGGSGCAEHRDTSCYICERFMLVCRVTVGKPCYQTAAHKIAHSPPGHHSVIGQPTPGGLAYREYVIYRGEQAYPEFMITYRLKP